MPLYDYSCPTCSRKREIFKPIAELDRTEKCTNCGFPMNRQVSAPMVIGDYPGYTCPISGKWIEGRRQHEENLARTGCRVLETGETASAVKARAQEEAQLDKAVDATVDEFVATIPSAKREALFAETAGGFDAEIVRTTPGE